MERASSIEFDIRDYWGYTLIDTSSPDFELFNTLSDDDIGFAPQKWIGMARSHPRYSRTSWYNRTS